MFYRIKLLFLVELPYIVCVKKIYTTSCGFWIITVITLITGVSTRFSI